MALSIPPQACLAVGVAVVLALVYRYLVYAIFLSPISRIPAAHPLACITPLWIGWQRVKNREFQCILKAFERLGPYVRLGPNEIAVNSKEGILSIYGVGPRNFDKHDSYEYFKTHGEHNMFSSISGAHARHKRRFAALYSQSSAQTSPHIRVVLRTVLLKRLMPLIIETSRSESGSIDILPIMQSYALDFMTCFQFGLPQGTNLIQDDKARAHWLDLYIRCYPADGINCLLEYKWITETLYRLGCQILPARHFEAKQEMEDWSTDMVLEAERRLFQSEKSGKPLADGDVPLLYKTVKEAIAREAGIKGDYSPNYQQQQDLASECFDHLVATRDTFGTSFSYVLYKISQRPDIQSDLRRELLSLEYPFRLDQTVESKKLPTPQALTGLPLLNAVLKEGLRLRNNTPGGDPRMTPAGTRSTIGPYKNLPPGIRVGAYGWCIHRKSALFPDPFTWDPSRWLGDERRQDGWFHAFGGVMRHFLAAVYTNFETSVADESEYPGDEGFVGGDCHEKLYLRFRPVNSTASRQ